MTELIGHGGAGSVWAAVDEVLQRRVAVKNVGAPPWLSMEGWQALRERALREARAAAAIGHPNVITVYDVVEEDNRPWIVMELLEARTLAQIIEDEGPWPPRQAAEIGLQVLAALQAAHGHGILHRDVKPSNVLVTGDGRAVLTDFGIATVEGDAALTASGLLVGAPAYIAPERIRGGTAVPASDLWSLGATLYTAVEGQPPYRREDPISTLAAAVYEDPDPTSAAGELAPLLAALLLRDPVQRPLPDQVERYLHRVAIAGPWRPGAELASGPLDEPATAALRFAPAALQPPPGAERPAPEAPQSPGSDQPDRRRVPGVALLTAAATALLAIMVIGYLARHTLEPGAPSHQPAVEEPAANQPVAGVEASSSIPAAGRATVPRSVPATATSPVPSTEVSLVGSQEPPATPSSVNATPTSAPEPPTTTVEPPPTSTQEPGPSPSHAGQTPSGLP
ncbi:MAG TPA: protein kinase [Pseudonocardiaceae bacterium]|jgi:serine/threonine protein kinase